MLIGTAEAAGHLFLPLFESAEREFAAVIHLDRRQRLLALTVEEEGDESAAELPVGAILRTSLRIGAAAIIVAHHHPSGEPMPSDEDLCSTRMLAEAAAALGIRLHDHLVFGGGEWRSFRALGFL